MTIFVVEELMWSSFGTKKPFSGTEKDPGAKEGGLFGWMEDSPRKGLIRESVLGKGYRS
jgi:hypothetical protein